MELTHTQQVLLNDAAKRSFRDIADQDYLTARMCYKNKLNFQFLWMSQQAIEKYIKCILLFNKTSVLDIGHNLKKGIKKINSIDYLKLDLSEKTINFIDYVNEQGPNRYFQREMYVQGLEIITLDRTVWELRRYCQFIDFEITMPKGNSINMRDELVNSIVQAKNKPPHLFKISGGYLEKRMKDNKYNQGDILIWKNFYYGKKRKNNIKIGRTMQANFPTQNIHPESLEFFGRFFKVN